MDLYCTHCFSIHLAHAPSLSLFISAKAKNVRNWNKYRTNTYGTPRHSTAQHICLVQSNSELRIGFVSWEKKAQSKYTVHTQTDTHTHTHTNSIWMKLSTVRTIGQRVRKNIRNSEWKEQNVRRRGDTKNTRVYSFNNVDNVNETHGVYLSYRWIGHTHNKRWRRLLIENGHNLKVLSGCCMRTYICCSIPKYRVVYIV